MISPEINETLSYQEYSNFDSLKYNNAFYKMCMLFIDSGNSGGALLLSLIDKLSLISPENPLYRKIAIISECFAQLIGYIDNAFLSLKVFCVYRWSAFAREKNSFIQSKMEQIWKNEPNQLLWLASFLKEQESKLKAEEWSAYYDVLRIVFGTVSHVTSTISFASAFIPGITENFLFPLKAIADLFTFARTWSNKHESNQLVGIQNRVVNRIEAKIKSLSYSDEEFSHWDETQKTDYFFYKALEAKVNMESRFIGAMDFENNSIAYFSFISASIGVIVSLSLLLGAPLASSAIILMGTSLIGSILMTALFCFQQGLLIYYRPNFLITYLKGNNTALIIYRVIFYAIKYFIDESFPGTSISFENNWLNGVKNITASDGWKDVLRLLPDSQWKQYGQQLPLANIEVWNKTKGADERLLDPDLLNETTFYIDGLLQNHFFTSM